MKDPTHTHYLYEDFEQANIRPFWGHSYACECIVTKISVIVVDVSDGDFTYR